MIDHVQRTGPVPKCWLSIVLKCIMIRSRMVVVVGGGGGGGGGSGGDGERGHSFMHPISATLSYGLSLIRMPFNAST